MQAKQVPQDQLVQQVSKDLEEASVRLVHLEQLESLVHLAQPELPDRGVSNTGELF